MTERSPGPAKLSPALAKVVLTVASVLGTLGGWLALASRDAPAADDPPPATAAPLPELVEVEPGTTLPPTAAPVRRVRALREVSRPPAPVTFTRSSR
jgi:hypothetical protein